MPDHLYLPENRLAWWRAGTRVPSTGPIVDNFIAEFISGISTLTGGALRFADEAGSVRAVDWDAGGPLAIGAIEGLGFAARISAPGIGVPRLERVRIANIPYDGGRSLVHRPDADNLPPLSIVIDFATPQRAVGLECGFSSEQPDRLPMDPARFKLKAWRSDGTPLPEATGESLPTDNWPANSPRRIGVRDQRGEIRTVELVCDDPAFAIGEYLFIWRLWSEPLPAAAVIQGVVHNSDDAHWRRYQHRLHPDLPVAAGVGVDDPVSNGVQIGQVSLELPYQFDRAAVFLRGFKFVVGTDLGLGANRAKISRMAVGLNKIPTDDRHFRFQLNASLVYGEQGTLSTAVIAAYYSVIAWRSDRADLHASPGVISHSTAAANAVVQADIAHAREVPPMVEGDLDPVGPLGPLCGGWSSILVQLPRPCEMQTFSLIAGVMGGTIAPDAQVYSGGIRAIDVLLLPLVPGWIPGARVSPVVGVFPPIGYIDQGRRLRWSYGLTLDDTLDDDESAATRIGGSVLTGTSLRMPTPAATTLTMPDVGPRHRQPQPFFRSPERLAMAVEAEMALPVLHFSYFKPDDELRELDVEVRGFAYDGASLSFDIGGAVDVEDTIGGFGLFGGDLRNPKTAFGYPGIVGIVPRAEPPRFGLSTAAMHFDWIVGAISMSEREPGVLKNDGTLPVAISAARVEATSAARAAEFALTIECQGDLTLSAPLVVPPGASALVRGRFWSSVVPSSGKRAQIRRRAVRIVFGTSLPLRPEVELDVVAERIATNAAGELYPSVSRFGVVRMPLDLGLRVIGEDEEGQLTALPPRGPQYQPPTRNVLLESHGQFPLVVTRLAFEPAVRGLEIGLLAATPSTWPAHFVDALYVLDPGTSHTFLVSWTPQRVGRMRSTLIVETNGGRLSMTVEGEGVPDPASPARPRRPQLRSPPSRARKRQ